MTAKAPDNNQYVGRITRLLEVLTMRGVRQHVIFEDWLGACYHTLRMLPAHVRHVREHGTPAPDDEEAAAYWGRLRGVYKPQDFNVFAEATGLLLESAEQLRNGVGDVLGDVYMAFAYPNSQNGQYFTSWDTSVMTVKLLGTPERLVFDNIKAAITSGDTPNHIAAQTVLMFGAAFQTPEETHEWFVNRVAPMSLACGYEPVKVFDPACGSGRMLVAYAAQMPAWMSQGGYVQFYGQDIDRTCVVMAQTNMMLYGLNGHALRWQAALAGMKMPAATETPVITAPATITTKVRQLTGQAQQLSLFD